MGILSGSLEEFDRPSWSDRIYALWDDPSYWNLLIVLPWLLGAIVCLWQCYGYARAATRQSVTSGHVTELAQGNRVHYEFTVAEHVYRNWEIPLNDRRVPSAGETVSVYYDSKMPTVNGITDLSTRSLDAFGPAPFLLLASGGVIVFILWRRRDVRNARKIGSLTNRHYTS